MSFHSLFGSCCAIAIMLRVLSGNFAAAQESWLAKNGTSEAAIFVGPHSGDFNRWVAGELQRYIRQLSGAELPILTSDEISKAEGKAILLVGNSENNPLIAASEKTRPLNFDKLKPDGFVLQSVELEGSPALVVGGKDKSGTMYAAYDLLERLGIVFQLTGDIIPDLKGDLLLPSLTARQEPALKRRGMHCCHALRWFMGQEDFRKHIDQLAKLKLNHLEFFWGMGAPWCEFSYDGKVAEIIYPKESGYLAWGGGNFWHTSTGSRTDIRVGRECFPREYLGPPEFANVETPAQAYDVARQFLHEVIRYAHSRKVKVCLALGEIPHVPPNLVPAGTKSLNGFRFERRYCGVAMPIGDPALLDIWEAAVCSMIEMYPDADSYEIWAPEHSTPVDTPEAKAFLSEFADKRKLIPTLEEIRRQGNFIPDDEAALDSDFAQICIAAKIVERVKQRHPDTQMGVLVLFRGYLLRALDAMVPKDVWLINMENCGNVASLMDSYAGMSGRELMVMPRIDDDGCELHMQLNAGMYDRDEIITGAAKYGLTGVVGQLNKERGLECNARYIADGAWNPKINAPSFYEGYLRRLYGQAAIEPMLQAFSLLEENDKALVWWGRSDIFIGYGRFEPCSLRTIVDFKREKPDVERAVLEKSINETWGESEFWKYRQAVASQHSNSIAMPPDAFWVSRAMHCRKALDCLREARTKVSPGSRAELEYVIFKTDNFIRYFEVLAASHQAKMSLDRAWLAKIDGDTQEFLRQLGECRASLERADRLARESAGQMIAYADVPTERYLLFQYNKNVIGSLEQYKNYLDDVIAFYDGQNLQVSNR